MTYSNFIKNSTFPEVLGVLKELKSKGYPSAILSNGTMEMLNNAAIKSNINNYLDIILSAEKLGAFKPNEKIIIWYLIILDAILRILFLFLLMAGMQQEGQLLDFPVYGSIEINYLRKRFNGNQLGLEVI